MAARKRKKADRERDLIEIERRLVRGETQIEIGRALEMSTSQVSYDVAKIESRWRSAVVADLNVWKAQELAKIDELERTFWKAWAESLKDKETTFTERTSGQSTEDAEKAEKAEKVRASVRREGSSGNPAFLDGVLSCVDRRIKLLGLDAPIRVDITEKVRAAAREMGVDEDDAVKEAQRIIQAARGDR